jgi:RNA polymerase sigma-70 factor (ECF subfamily)
MLCAERSRVVHGTDLFGMTAKQKSERARSSARAKPSPVSAIWRELHGGLRAFIAKRVTDQSEVDDLLQEVFLRVHRRVDRLRDPDRIVAWLFQIARHAVIDHYRARRNREVPVGLADAVDAAVVRPESRRDAEQTRQELAACLGPMLKQLSMEYREAITLVELNGLTGEEAAKRMGLSVSGMKSRVQRGRRQLRQMIEDCCRIEFDRRGQVADYEPRDAQCDPCRGRDVRPSNSPSCSR